MELQFFKCRAIGSAVGSVHAVPRTAGGAAECRSVCLKNEQNEISHAANLTYMSGYL